MRCGVVKADSSSVFSSAHQRGADVQRLIASLRMPVTLDLPVESSSMECIIFSLLCPFLEKLETSNP
jgi:hypothetical protein